MVNRKSSVLCATINGVELEYIVQGSGEPVVLSHGSIYSDSYFPLMAQPILANHYLFMTPSPSQELQLFLIASPFVHSSNQTF